MTTKNTARLSSKFQISIPKSVCAARHWQAGQMFAFVPKGEGLLLVPVPELADLIGMADGANTEGVRDRAERV